MTEKKTIELINLFYRIKSFKPNEIKNKGLRLELLDKQIVGYDEADPFFAKPIFVRTVIEHPENYKLRHYRCVTKLIDRYKELDIIIKDKE